MSEQVYINGNTYTLGATVGAIAGTGGSTNYFFSFQNLISGSTYNFIVVAYNFSGFSGYAGPVIVYNPPGQETRPEVFVFAWDWPNYSGAQAYRVWSSGSTANLVTSSFDMSRTDYNWGGQNITETVGGQTDPFGGTDAMIIRCSGLSQEGGFPRYCAWLPMVYNVESGNTYVFSFWHNVTTGTTIDTFRAAAVNSSNTGPYAIPVAVNQLLPTPISVRSPSNEQSIQYQSGLTGWVRFAYEFYVGLTHDLVRCHIISKNNPPVDVPNGYTMYFYGPQLIKGTTTTPYVSTTTGGAASDLYVTKYYFSTFNDAANFTNIKYTATDQEWLNFGPSAGISYCYGLINPIISTLFEPSYARNINKSPWIRRSIQRLKNLPSNARAIQPNLFNGYYTNLFDEDKLTFSGGTLRQYIINDYTLNLTSSVANFYPDPWPSVGICGMQNIWNQFIDLSKNEGATIDYVFIDKEGTFFDGDLIGACANIANVLISGNTQYSQTWNGLSSWKTLYESNGGLTNGAAGGAPTNYNYSYNPKPYFLAWSRTAQTYDAKTLDLVLKDKYLSSYPGGYIGNYDDYISDPGMCGGAHDGNGHPWPRGAYMGNATSPVLYGLLGQIVPALNNNNDVWTINTTDPTRLDYFGSGETLGIGPWTSFVQAMNELRMAKRNAPNVAMKPWIGAASWTTERQWLKSVCWSGPNISPQEVRDQLDTLGLNGATFKFWSPGPHIGFGDAVVGYNPKEFCYYTENGGNSGYFFELVRHIMLHGVKAIGWFNPTTFMDWGESGISFAQYNSLYNLDNLNFSQLVMREYFMAGLTSHIGEMKALDNTLQEVFDRTGGFTLTTADTGKIAWNSEWVASGAPGLNGTTWWWRITGSPKYVVTVDGTHILSATGPGMWLGTTGPTLGVEITSSPVLGAG